MRNACGSGRDRRRVICLRAWDRARGFAINTAISLGGLPRIGPAARAGLRQALRGGDELGDESCIGPQSAIARRDVAMDWRRRGSGLVRRTFDCNRVRCRMAGLLVPVADSRSGDGQQIVSNWADHGGLCPNLGQASPSLAVIFLSSQLSCRVERALLMRRGRPAHWISVFCAGIFRFLHKAFLSFETIGRRLCWKAPRRIVII